MCCRFSTATGWPLLFAPRGADVDERSDQPVTGDLDRCWAVELNDGDELLGRLQIELPQDERRDRSFLSVCELAEIVAGLINRFLSAQKGLDSRTRDVSTLVDIGRSTAGEEDLTGALTQLLRAAVAVTGFRGSAFFLLNPSTNQLNLRGTWDLRADQIPQAHRQLDDDLPDLKALVYGPMLVRRRLDEESSRWLPKDSAIGLCVAVQSESGPLGTLWTFDRRERVPGQRETQVLESIAGQISSFLERVVLLHESAEKHRLKRDLLVASESQTSNLDTLGTKRFGFDSAAICTSRYELGGDLCELIPIDEHRTVVAVGDASGDSVPAAMVMSAVRGALRTLSDGHVREMTDTGGILRRINHMLFDITPAYQFMSLVYGVLDTALRTFVYTNAGHPLPLLLRNGRPLSLRSHGLLLGVSSDSTYGRSTAHLQPGDLLVAFTDGISEAQDQQHRLFGSAGIVEVMTSGDGQTAKHVLSRIWSKLEIHTREISAADDRTLLVIRFPEPATTSSRS